jgi:hypothetical protein
VSETLVAFAGVADVSEVPDVVLLRYSPMLPALALLFVVVPTMPAVCDGVMAPVAFTVVKAAVLGVVTPIAGGELSSFITNAVDAICVVLVCSAAVVVAGTPVNVGEAVDAGDARLLLSQGVEPLNVGRTENA